MNESGSNQLEVWVAEDSPFYRLVVEEAMEEISKVTDSVISLTVFERFADIQEALEKASRTGQDALPAAVLSDLHFPDNAYSDLQSILDFYGRYAHLVPVSYMSCNSSSLAQAQGLSQIHTNALVEARFLRKDTSDTMSDLVRIIHAMIFAPRISSRQTNTSTA